MIFATQWLLFDIRMTFMGLKIANNGTFVFLFWLQGPYTSIYMYPCNTLGACLIKWNDFQLELGLYEQILER